MDTDRSRRSNALLEMRLIGSITRKYAYYFSALLRREQHSRLSDPISSFLEVMEPIFLIAVMTAATQFIGRRDTSPLGDSPVLFYATGFFFLYYFIYLSNRMKRSVDNPTRRFPMERRLDHILVHILLRTTDYMILGIVLFSLIYVFFSTGAFPNSFTYLFMAMISAVMLGFGWGIMNLVLARAWKLWGFLFPLVNRSLVLFTGVVFLVDFLSPGVRHILSFIPLVHAVALFRLAFFPNQPMIVFDLSYLAWTALLAVAIGVILERITVRSESLER
jgi:capsular polysaccharide transport system permease protein